VTAEHERPAPDLSTPQHILHWARRRGDAVAIVERDRTTTYRDLAMDVARFVKALRASSWSAGMLAGIACDDRHVHLRLLLACEILGVTTISLAGSALASDDDVTRRCDVLCLGAEHTPDAARPGQGLLHLSSSLLGRIGQLPVSPSDLALLDHRPTDDTVVTLVRTSGSTGRPKVLAMTHGATRRLIERTTWQPNDPGYAWNFVNLYNFTNRSSYQETAIALRRGCTVALSSMDTVFHDFARFEQFRTTLVSGDAVRLAQAIPPGWSGPRDGLVHIKGGALRPRIRAMVRRFIVRHVYHNYGANEVSRLTILDDDDVGTLLPDVEIRIMTEADQPSPACETGLIEARAPGMATSYLWDPETSAQAFHDGWYRTGDVGFMPAPDRLVVLGRADDWVNLGGIKFAPGPIEHRIADLPDIKDAVLLSIQAPSGRDILHVVLESAVPDAERQHRDALIAILTGHTDIFVPHVLPSLPRTETGKVRRGLLRDLLAQRTGAMAV